MTTAVASQEPIQAPAAGGAAAMLPALRELLAAMPAEDICRLLQAERRLREAAACLRPQVLAQRGRDPAWSWRKVRAVEGALFCDLLGDPGIWKPGPNERGACNVLEREGGEGPWLWLSGGTDWQGFQGGFRNVSEEGLRPAWVSFRVRVATPTLSGAFFTLSGEQHLWGLADPVMVFSYRGDDCSSGRRCFSVQPYAKHGAVPLFMQPESEVAGDRPYDVALRLDWETGMLSAYLDGKLCIEGVPFKASTPIRYVAIYNWRSGARTAFSELALGRERPSDVPLEPPRRRFTRSAALRRACGPCRRRWTGGAGGALLRLPRPPRALCGAFVATALALAVHWVQLQ
mmetsp:Transcript_23125/g.66717  ORF Transcript_23125/g.66717 Transcript_23125/m.66717 type:complete len:345 (+) Transcript_23125:98-1132(+)